LFVRRVRVGDGFSSLRILNQLLEILEVLVSALAGD
jgi:hypothetical protein